MAIMLNFMHNSFAKASRKLISALQRRSATCSLLKYSPLRKPLMVLITMHMKHMIISMLRQ